VTVIDWRMAILMNKSSNNSRLYLLLINLFIQLGLLFYFKYLIFFVDSGINLAQFIGVELSPVVLNIILPLGISFYTFQSISYIVDVYRRSIKPERSYLIYACYVTYFPQLVAGPILRANEIIPQFKNYSKFNLNNFNIGGRLIINGLFLKVVLADNIAPLVDNGYSLPLASISALDVWTLAFLFGFQI
jgi:D-alanyl-lipoteichoic acid acyltransferase DltB (MBOAT superfamily)